MAKNRYINTKFWNDGYVSELNPNEKLLFLYLLTNPTTNISGVYELPVKNIVLDTGLGEETVRNILSRFGVDDKVLYIDGWIVIRNFLKHQKQESPTVRKGIEKELKLIPEYIQKKIKGIGTLSHLNLNSNFNSDLDVNAASPSISEQIKTPKFQSLLKEMAESDYLSVRQLEREAEEKFAPHWDERGEGQKKARWEKEKSFDICLRFRKWVMNTHDWKKDVRCRAAGKWHPKGDLCYHGEPEPDYKNLPASEFARSINKQI